MLIRFLLEIIALLFAYFIIPLGYNEILCLIFLVYYAFQLIRFFRKIKIDNYFAFNVIFFTMYTLVTYLVPIFYLLGLENLIFSIVSYEEKYIIRSLIISSIAVSCYTYGYLIGIKKINKISYSSIKILNNIKIILKINTALSILFCVIFIISFDYLVKSDSRDLSGYFVTFINCVFIYSFIICGYSNLKYNLNTVGFVKKHIIVILSGLFIVIRMLMIGDRVTPLCLTLSLLFVYSHFVKKISFKQYIVLVVSGVFLLFLISFTRNDKMSLSKGISSFSNIENKAVIFQDVFPINLDFYLGIEWQDHFGYHKPERIILPFLAPFPYVPAYVKEEYLGGDPSSAMLLTLYNRSIVNITDNSGIGTHIVLDVFISWGIIGVILLFSLFGYLVGLSYTNVSNIYGLIVYGSLMSYSVYMPRDTIFTPIRDIIYISIIMFVVLKIVYRK